MAAKPRQPDTVRDELQILTEALAAFEQTTDTAVEVLATDIGLPMTRADAKVRLGNGRARLVEVKRNLTPTLMGAVVAQLGRLAGPTLLVTRYVTPQMAERLKTLGVEFIDTAGNAYVRLPQLLVYVVGRKPLAAGPREKPVRAFRATGLKILFALLCQPELIDAPYRDIAEEVGVALGAVGWTVGDLKRMGYVSETRAKGRALVNRQGLMDAWVEAYPHELRPRLAPRRYRVEDPNWWRHANLDALQVWLGGEPAAAQLVGYLRPGLTTIYGTTHWAQLARKLHAAKDEHGNLEVLERFWKFQTPVLAGATRHVPPLLVYADLVATGDARNLETAEMIREKFLGLN